VVKPPEGEVTIVFTDITRAASLWEFNAGAMRDATLMHNETLRAALKKHRGYEVVFIRDRNSGEGSFCMAFQSASDAVAWCSEVQQALLRVEWPEALLEHPGAAEEWGDTDDRYLVSRAFPSAFPDRRLTKRGTCDRVLYKGLRVRMGVHMGTPRVVRDPMTRRVEFIGPVVNAAARITAMTHGGQIVLSHTVHDKIKDAGPGDAQGADDAPRRRLIVALGKFEIADAPHGTSAIRLLRVALCRQC
jgi:class 3 adenylate cyclase